MHDPEQLLHTTSQIVCAVLATAGTSAANLPALISRTYAALAATDEPTPAAAPAKPAPAVSVRSSIKQDHIVSLIDGKPYKVLRRHLGLHGFTPETYRAAYGLPANYPMVAPSYAAQRAQLARDSGLGRKKAA